MKKIIIIFVFLGAVVLPAKAQFDIKPADILTMLAGYLNSDRPGKAINPKTAGILAFQIQTGLNFEKLVPR